MGTAAGLEPATSSPIQCWLPPLALHVENEVLYPSELHRDPTFLFLTSANGGLPLRLRSAQEGSETWVAEWGKFTLSGVFRQASMLVLVQDDHLDRDHYLVLVYLV